MAHPHWVLQVVTKNSSTTLLVPEQFVSAVMLRAHPNWVLLSPTGGDEELLHHLAGAGAVCAAAAPLWHACLRRGYHQLRRAYHGGATKGALRARHPVHRQQPHCGAPLQGAARAERTAEHLSRELHGAPTVLFLYFCTAHNCTAPCSVLSSFSPGSGTVTDCTVDTVLHCATLCSTLLQAATSSVGVRSCSLSHKHHNTVRDPS
eukprot:1188664-Prorocentrum_minimum.AAC.3